MINFTMLYTMDMVTNMLICTEQYHKIVKNIINIMLMSYTFYSYFNKILIIILMLIRE